MSNDRENCIKTLTGFDFCLYSKAFKELEIAKTGIFRGKDEDVYTKD
jgi:hypothetical protein